MTFASTATHNSHIGEVDLRTTSTSASSGASSGACSDTPSGAGAGAETKSPSPSQNFSYKTPIVQIPNSLHVESNQLESDLQHHQDLLEDELETLDQFELSSSSHLVPPNGGTHMNKSSSVVSHVSLASTLSSVSDTVHTPHKAYKRSSSSSNDLIYERDRFRARLKSFNDTNSLVTETKLDVVEDETNCDVCDGIGCKTAKLNIDLDKKEADEIDDFQFQNITIDQLRNLFDQYFNKGLPNTNSMFPWLHGLHVDNFAQRSFFLMQQQQMREKAGQNSSIFNDFKLLKPENISFLMCINDGTIPVQLHNTVQLNEILQKIDVSRSEVKEIVRSIYKKEQGSQFDDESEMLKLLFDDCTKLNVLPRFTNLDPDRGISLRNFHIQVAKLSTCSDFLVYGTSPENMRSIARVLWLAQKAESHENSDGTKRRIFILESLLKELYEEVGSPIRTSPLRSFFHYSKLDASHLHFEIKDSTLLLHDCFQISEKIETTKMSTATKLTQNVWVGNFWDHQIMIDYLLNGKSVNTQPTNPNLYNDPLNSLIVHKNVLPRDFINFLPKPKANYKLFIQCHADASFPDLEELAHLLYQYTITSHDNHTDAERHHLQFPPLGSIGLGDCKRENLQSIVNTCKLIYLYSSTLSADGLGSLIYCSDGYTESSLLVFCYIMYSMNLPLDEAMLKLHLEYGRPFYIFNSDVVILRKLEPLLKKFSPLVKKDLKWEELEQISPSEINEILLGVLSSKANRSNKLGFIANDEDGDDSSDSDSVGSNLSDEELESKYSIDWVKEVEGSIPSKILPYLYLGSLKHALCLPLLNKLGIKKIISVGESLPWLNGFKFQKYNDVTVDESDDGSIEFFNISPSKSHCHHRPLHWNTSINTVMKVNNLEDDGIDELMHQLPPILDFIDDACRKDPNTKILVHCRVGVSRSATVVISEIMRRMNVSLPMAYLYVRVRRLNIIIQPNLRFMYELFKWEEFVKEKQKRLTFNDEVRAADERSKGNFPDTIPKYPDGTYYLREIDWFIMCREIMKLNLPYVNC